MSVAAIVAPTPDDHALTALVPNVTGNITAPALPVTAISSAPADAGQWSSVLQWPFVAVHMSLLPTGKILAWEDRTDGVSAEIFDPTNNTLTAVPFNIANLFCSG